MYEFGSEFIMDVKNMNRKKEKKDIQYVISCCLDMSKTVIRIEIFDSLCKSSFQFSQRLNKWEVIKLQHVSHRLDKEKNCPIEQVVNLDME